MFQIKINNKILLIFLLITTLFPISVLSQETAIEKFRIETSKSGYDLYEVATYIGYTGKKFTIAWDANPEPDIYGYEFRAYHVEQKRYIGKTIELVGPNSNEYEFTPTISGHYVFEIRAKDLAGQYSDWASTMDPDVGSVNDKKEGWWVYVYIAPPSDDITFE